MKIVSAFVFLMAALSSKAQCPDSMPLWLLGKWQIQNESGLSFEEWTLSNDTLMVGRTYSFYGNDTLELDRMRIVCSQGSVVFYMNASVNNNNIVVPFFPDKDNNSKVWAFYNPDAAFPHTFRYVYASADECFVSFESNNPLEACTDFKMIRISR
ncbi:MAG: hypothetical protein KBB11_02180 [Bacteroidales bacterium]|nr:hypothetical protein [Bacteroidales bacterium]HOY39560.1 hypothetical protein [Bacteroidales bacterium]HQP04000.1 hypothetical protein [Bacteroidales bacterium]